jgi:hypothetical protein
MEELQSVNYLNLLAIPELCKKNFFIPKYQRGYRWGEDEVYRLIDDLYTFFYKEQLGKFYCLQPVVVRKMTTNEVQKFELDSDYDNNTWYEVIDGQQRLTTIRIILALESLLDEDNNDKFNIHYETRPNLGNVFKQLRRTKNDEHSIIDIIPNWKLDIDSWHVIKAAQKIMDYFESDAGNATIKEFKGKFNECFTNTKDKETSVQVIWYEVRDDSDMIDLFKRLNDKRISLNNAELIRGLFLSDAADYKIDPILLKGFAENEKAEVKRRECNRMQQHIIETWDIIEKELRSDKFWAFVTVPTNSTFSCRIEYIFDLIAKKKEGERNPLYTYWEFKRMIDDGDVADLWNLWLLVETYFSTLQAWSRDRYYFHTIGYLIAVSDSTCLISLLERATKNTKSVLKSQINKEISQTITERKDPTRNIFSYDYENDYNLLKRCLFLYNVETVRQNESMDFFPFNLYKEKQWTLEHIHAQNSERLDASDRAKWIEWVDVNINALDTLFLRLKDDKALESLIMYLKELKDGLDGKLKKKKELYTFTKDIVPAFDRVQSYFSNKALADGLPREIHSISNMALLDNCINSEIGNSVFEVKRQYILSHDAQGDYIPYCTRKVFLKYQNKDDADFTVQQNFFWSEKDRKNYQADIRKVLKLYIDIIDKTNVEQRKEEPDE